MAEYVIFKFFQRTPCGYSKLVSQDAWQDAKNYKLIDALWTEKTSKNSKNMADLENAISKWLFGLFLSPQCTNHVLVFCILSGISRYKFRVPTWGTLEKLENHIFSHIPYFYVLWARWLWKFQSWALLFWYSCMFRNLIQ